MKKIIRLTESDLVRIVKRVITEQTNMKSVFDRLQKMSYGSKNFHPSFKHKYDNTWSIEGSMVELPKDYVTPENIGDITVEPNLVTISVGRGRDMANVYIHPDGRIERKSLI